MNLFDHQFSCKEYTTPIAVRNKLNELGIPEEFLVKSAQQAFIEKATYQIFDPVGSDGYDAWRYAVRSLRKDLERNGFRLDDPKNLPLCISDEHQINVTVSSGDKMTGILGTPKQPKSKNIKGAMFLAAIDRNLGQGDLFPESIPENIAKFEQTLLYSTWVYLIRITDDDIFAELSQPSSMDSAGHINRWSERISIVVPLPDEKSYGIDEDDNDAVDVVPFITNKI